MICPNCDNKLEAKFVIFSDGTKHLEVKCTVCEKHFGFKPHVNSSDFVLPIGRYKGLSISQVAKEDQSYLLWAAREMKSNVGRKIKSFLEEQNGN